MEEGPSETGGGFAKRNLGLIALAVAVVALVLSLLPQIGGLSPLVQPGAQPAAIPYATPATTPDTEQQAGSDTGKPVTNPVTGVQVGVQCPADSCLPAVSGAGSCPNSGEPYVERECYDYPDTADRLIECEQQRTVYYEVCGVRQ